LALLPSPAVQGQQKILSAKDFISKRFYQQKILDALIPKGSGGSK
jgi:hypothetical protein